MGTILIIKETTYQLDRHKRINPRGRSKKLIVKTIKLPVEDENGHLYQTVIIGGEHGGKTWRCETKEQAFKCHKTAELFLGIIYG